MNIFDLIIGAIGVIIIGLYFINNPLRHGGWFLMRRFINWFPMGMTYAFLYMGRYNLTVAKNALGTMMRVEDFGIIFAIGTFVYACSFLVTGPLVDKIGGKRGILIAAGGTAGANILLGVMTYFLVIGKLHVNLVVAFSVLYAINMFFQSFGGLSFVKVKASWFHVRERGMFSAIFGSLISIGIYFAFDWGEKIAGMTKAGVADGGWLGALLRRIFATDVTVGGKLVDATWAVFFVPAIILIFWVLINALLVKATPEDAGFPPFDTSDASSEQAGVEFSMPALLKKFFTSKLMLMIAVIGLTSGVCRNGVQNWYSFYSKQVPQTGAEFVTGHLGFWFCIFGIAGGFFAGAVSDYFFQSRRGPPAAMLAGLAAVMTIVMAVFVASAPLVLAFACLCVLMSAVGLASIMTSTAAVDFGGRKASATCSGLVDGFTYVGSGIQSFCIGFLVPNQIGDGSTFFGLFPRSWHWWPLFLLPFALLGMLVAIKIWNALPDATRKYNAEAEARKMKMDAGQ